MNKKLIDEILDLELDMFMKVPAKTPVSCQEDPDGFRLHRGAQFSVWSEQTLLSYRNDLVEAGKKGDNLMILKYARMEGIIPPLKTNPLITEIAEIEFSFQKDVLTKYPNVLAGSRALDTDTDTRVSFITYLKCELETYSDKTLELFLQDIRGGLKDGRNLTEEIYTFLMQQVGFESLDHAEEIYIQRQKESDTGKDREV